MARVYVGPERIRDGAVALEGAVLRHVRTVLRLGAGDALTVTDGVGGEYATRIESAGRAAGVARVLERSEPRRESPLRTVLAQAVPRGDRFALVLQKAVELGVSEIVPVVTRRSLPGKRGAGEDAAGSERWQRIVQGAVEQCGRTRLPPLHPARPWEEVAAAGAGADLSLLLWEGAREGFDALLDRPVAPRTVLIAVGPEGGWSEEEVALGERGGFRPVRLGPRILRTETAGIAALAVVQQRWGDLGAGA